MTKYINGELIRFVIIGAMNAGSTFLVYLIFLLFMSYHVAYTLSYLLGIGISYSLNSWIVFKQKMTLKKALQYPIVYVVQYMIGILCLTLLVDWVGLSKQIAPIVVIIITIPVTFLMSRWIIKSPKIKRHD